MLLFEQCRGFFRGVCIFTLMTFFPSAVGAQNLIPPQPQRASAPETIDSGSALPQLDGKRMAALEKLASAPTALYSSETQAQAPGAALTLGKNGGVLAPQSDAPDRSTG